MFVRKRQADRGGARNGPGRRGLAPVELLLALPVWMMIAALMVLVGTTGVWRVRTQTIAREAAFRSVWPRTRSADPAPAEWFPPSATMQAGVALPAITNVDPLSTHTVVRGPQIMDPLSRQILRVDSSRMAPWSPVIRGSAALDHAAPVWRRLGYRYRMEREFPVVSGEAGQFVPVSPVSRDQRRAALLWNLSF